MIDVEDKKLRDAILSLLASTSFENMPAEERPSQAYVINSMFQQTIEKLVGSLRDLEHKNQKLEGQYKDEVKQSESLREEMNGIKQTKKETEEKFEKWLRDIDVVC